MVYCQNPSLDRICFNWFSTVVCLRLFACSLLPSEMLTYPCLSSFKGTELRKLQHSKLDTRGKKLPFQEKTYSVLQKKTLLIVDY